MVRLLLIPALIFAQLSYGSCLERYQDNIDNNKTFMQKIMAGDTSGYGFPLLGYYGGYAIIGTNAAAFGGMMILPVSMVTTHFIVDGIHDAQLRNAQRLIKGSEYYLNITPVPTIDLNTKVTLVIDADDKKGIRKQKRYNKVVISNNETLAKANTALLTEYGKTQETFISFYNQVIKVLPNITLADVAKTILAADQSKKLCDGSVRFPNKDLSVRNDIVPVDGTKKEQRQAKRHNRKVDRHNYKINKIIKERGTAKVTHVLEYVIDELK